MNRHLATIGTLLLLVGASISAVFAEPRVVTTIKPLQMIATAVMDGVAMPTVLIPSTQSPHHFTLRPSDVRRLTEADVVLWVGPEMETYLTSLFGQLDRGGAVIEAANLPGLVLHSPAGDDEHIHADADDHGRYDPHIWLDTGNAALIAERLHEELIMLDPANESRYRSNMARFRESIRLLEMRISTDMAVLKDGRYAVYHNGIQYFEKQFGVEHQFALVPDHEIQPGIRHLLALRKLLEARPLTCVIEDVNANEATINTVFRDYPVNRVRIDPLGDVIALDQHAYVRLIENLALALRHCLGQ